MAEMFRRQPDPFKVNPGLTEYRVRDARVIAPGWHVAYSKEQIILNMRPSHYRWAGIDRKSIATGLIRAQIPPVWIEHRDAAVLLGGFTNYYHHLIDYITSLMYVDSNESLSDLPLITLEASEAFHVEIFRHLGIPETRLIRVPAGSAVACSELVMLPHAFVKHGRCVDPRAFSWLRSRFTQPSLARRRLYVSRQAAKTRRLKNERVIAAILAHFGFETIILERMSFSQQVELFAEAAVIVGVHGAGLANIVFSPPGTPVVELRPGDTMPARLHFQQISEGAGHKHTYVWGSPGFDATDFELPADALRETLSSII